MALHSSNERRIKRLPSAMRRAEAIHFGHQIAAGKTPFKPLSKRARSGNLFTEPHPALAHLTAAAHHGVTASTHHGPGGIKVAKITKAPRPKVIKSTAKRTVRAAKGEAKIPSSLKHDRPGIPHAPKIHIPKVKI